MVEQRAPRTVKPDSRPLVVDLDATLSRTDTLHEALLRLLARRPLALVGLVARLPAGKAAFKRHVADRQIVPSDTLPLDPRVLALARAARAAGRQVLLVSAADQRQVAAVARELEVFDDAVGTGHDGASGTNLGGRAKAAYLTARFGAGGFDYVGDCARDIPVWQAAATAWAIDPSPRLQTRARKAGVTLRDVATAPEAGPEVPAPGGWRAWLRALRPHQWSKNALVFLPMLAAQDFSQAGAALLAFVLFSLTASSVYVLNDLVDLASDRVHPRKRRRPFAAGAIPVMTGLGMAGALLATAVLLAALLMPPVFVAVLAIYFAITLAYSFVLKRKLIVDVITLAGLYTLRILAGAAATGIVPSPWLLAFSVFLFYALAAIKRQGELVDQAAQGKLSTPGRGYVASDAVVMQVMAISAGQAAVLIFALYLYSDAVAALYAVPEILWLICPVLLYWLSRIAILTHRGHMDDDPIVFAAKDRISLLTLAVIVAILVAAEWGGRLIG